MLLPPPKKLSLKKSMVLSVIDITHTHPPPWCEEEHSHFAIRHFQMSSIFLQHILRKDCEH